MTLYLLLRRGKAEVENLKIHVGYQNVIKKCLEIEQRPTSFFVVELYNFLYIKSICYGVPE